jgi:hypothetical protein
MASQIYKAMYDGTQKSRYPAIHEERFKFLKEGKILREDLVENELIYLREDNEQQ